jgi:hypothetical protein
MDECTRLHTIIRSTLPGPQHKAASKALKLSITQAKHKWAHDQLHQAVDAQDIWTLTRVCKGRQANTVPPLCDNNSTLVDNPIHKAQIFQNWYFLENPQWVNLIQDDDPPSLPTQAWDPITPEEISTALKTASDFSMPGPSRIGYRILKWAHATSPHLLTLIFNHSIDTGSHLWKHATVVILNKPNKPDYSLAKVYRPISLLECTTKLLEKIVAKRVNANIISANLLPMSQFGSRPQYNALDAITTLTHKIQATRQTGNVGALLLFDISGFFDNVNPDQATQVFRQKGTPENICH